MELFGDFIRLDTEERTKFINTNLTYLIETIQTQNFTIENSTEQTNSVFNTGYDSTSDKLETTVNMFLQKYLNTLLNILLGLCLIQELVVVIKVKDHVTL